ncbi:MAG: fabG 20 [Alphaproteobacteria bacterium]|nr:fabG 20 [Alphaproteobacteria bacterium]
MRLQGRVALVTGAGGPMGRAVATRFAEEGASLVIGDISGSRLAESEASITENLKGGARLVAMRGNSIVREEARALAQNALTTFGKVDLLVNIVGGIRAKTMFEPLVGLSETRWDETMAFNLKPNLHLSQVVVPGMLERRYGKIVNISSINFAGEIGSADYSAAKAAVASLTRTMAIELAPHINVNCIAPGIIRTSVIDRMTPDVRAHYEQKPLLKRLGEATDIANAALFLCSDESSYITGQILAVSGGIWPALG